MLRVAKLIVFTLMVSAFPSAHATTQAEQTNPNVLMICIDDLNDWIGALGGHPQAKTPHIDALVARGTLFTRAYCAAPACKPSRAALLTGTRPSTTGCYYNSSNGMRKNAVMQGLVTFPQHFRNQGYLVIGGGKIEHMSVDRVSWDSYFPSMDQDKPVDPKPEGSPVNGKGNFDWAPLAVKDSAMGDSKVAEWAVEQLGKPYDRPVMIGVGLYRPHLPWHVPQKYFDQYPLDSIQLPKVLDNDVDDLPPTGKKMARNWGDHAFIEKNRQWHKAVQGYLACISFVDDKVGEVMAALEAREDADEWVVVLLSDHGWKKKKKEHWRKFALWEDTSRVVFSISVPGKGQPGARFDDPVSLIDLYPTLVEACGLPQPSAHYGLEGESLLPYITGAQAKRQTPVIITQGPNNHAIRSGDWRYIRYASGGEELYNLIDDPDEWHNLAGDPKHKSVQLQLSEMLPEVNVPVDGAKKRKK